MDIVIYGSQYGTAKRYAEELANRTRFVLKSYEDVEDINTYETIIYIGALYAGGVMGMKKTFKNMKDCGNHRIIIATVGLADPSDKENTDTIKNGMKNQLSKEVYYKEYRFQLKRMIREKNKDIVPKKWQKELDDLIAAKEELKMPYSEVITNLASCEALEHNRKELTRMIENESHARKHTVTRKNELSL